ncbi:MULTISPECIES: DUF397 domain-containing protein [unclassified Streptomyces]|uniref:DUF397 domain-containing protein n=1 Tax=unclassified Streptomyces TaxID=2593676 RepID=UPI002E2809AE|nr:DUF397 domain-containing protein [Streptomyces sp. NBC_00223]
MTAPLTWQKSTYSNEGGDCLELAAHGGAVLLRESDNPAIVLTTTRKDLARFLQFLKGGPTAHARAVAAGHANSGASGGRRA